MNIFFFFEAPITPNRGGVQRVANTLAREFSKRGHRLFSIYYRDVGNYCPNSFFLEQYYIPLDGGSFIQNVRSLIMKNQVDIVIVHELTENARNFLFALPSNVKRYAYVHIQPFRCIGYERSVVRHKYMPTFKDKILKLLTLFLPLIYRYHIIKIDRQFYLSFSPLVDRFVLLSNLFIPRVLQYCPELNETKFIAIPNPNTFDEGEYSSKSKEKLILWVGRMQHDPKNPRAFLSFWEKFSAKYPDWNAIMLGDGKERISLQKIIDKRSLKNITLLGNVPNTSDFYKRASFILMTSFGEGWGMVLTEAASYGCVPCAFNSYESITDIISDHKTGIIVKPFDIDCMVERMSELINNNMITSVGESASLAVSRYSSSFIADIWENQCIF